jgi:hypothetical protein
LGFHPSATPGELVHEKGETMRILMCTLMALGWAVTALADDGNSLLEICKAPEGSQARYNCLGYVLGVSDTLADLTTMGALPGSPCLPTGVTAGQMSDVVVKYLAENPKNRSFSSASLVIGALTTAWPPCNKQGK